MKQPIRRQDVSAPMGARGAKAALAFLAVILIAMFVWKRLPSESGPSNGEAAIRGKLDLTHDGPAQISLFEQIRASGGHKGPVNETVEANGIDSPIGTPESFAILFSPVDRMSMQLGQDVVGALKITNEELPVLNAAIIDAWVAVRELEQSRARLLTGEDGNEYVSAKVSPEERYAIWDKVFDVAKDTLGEERSEYLIEAFKNKFHLSGIREYDETRVHFPGGGEDDSIQIDRFRNGDRFSGKGFGFKYHPPQLTWMEVGHLIDISQLDQSHRDFIGQLNKEE